MKTGWCKVFPLFLLLVLIPTLCFSQTKKLPVEIKYEDTDTVGLRLAYQIEQLIKKSSSLSTRFRINDPKGEPITLQGTGLIRG